MKIKNEKEALQMFCEEENDYRDKFKKPFVNEKDGGRIWATNGYILLMVDPKLTRCKYTAFSQNRLNVGEVNTDRQIKFSEIDKAYMKFKLVEEVKSETGDDIECKDCDGEGEVEYSYHARNGRTYYETHECPICQGTGVVPDCKMIPTGKMLLPRYTYYKFGEATFDAATVMQAVKGLRKMGFESMTHRVSSERGINLFSVAEGIELIVNTIIYDRMQEKSQRIKVY